LAKRVLITGLFHETNTFLRKTTTWEDFTSTSAAEIRASAGEPSQAAGAVEVGLECGWEMIPGPYLMARPSGPVADAVVESFWEELFPYLTGVDAIFLVLHGAMVATSFPDVEGELLTRIRRVTGVLIAGPLDLHGNITDRMCVPNAAFSAYRHNPHTDSKETAKRAAYLLDRLLTMGERPVMVREQPALIWPPTGTASAADPMRSLLAVARQIEANHSEIRDIGVFAGFSFADIPECGPAFLAVTLGDPEEARRHLRHLCDLAVSDKEAGYPTRVPLEEALDRLQANPPAPNTRPVLLVEPSDNIGGGTPGDTTTVLRGLVERGIKNAAVALADPEAVGELWDLPIGAIRILPLGGKSGEIGCDPVTLTVEKVSQSNGEYTLEDRTSHGAVYGLTQQMGRSVVVRTENGVTILLNSLKTAPMDLGQWRSQGIDPETLSVIGIKAAVSHRRAYDGIASEQITVDTPGPCDENLLRMPYRNVRRPVWPLDQTI
jgi:microcystin degradation protein MlrC